MNNNELDFILKQGEGQFIEFKEALDKSIAKHMAAFANSSGGRILLGITDDGIIKGFKASNMIKSQIQDLAKHCDPPVQIEMEPFGNILIISIAEGDNKPYSCSQGFYIRTGPNSQKLSRDEILEFSIDEGRISFDEQINSAFDYDKDFDQAKLDHYLNLTGLTRNLPVKDILINLKAAKLVNNELKFNNAGVLFFAKNPEKYFLTSKVVCVNYQTNEKVNILDRKIFDDGIVTNIKEAIDYVSRHINVRFEIKELRRKEVSQYPAEAYREAIVNAIMHRDYFDRSGDTLIEIFKNKLIISNPGGLVKWLKAEDFGKYSRARNQIIAELLAKTKYVEKLGTGINRIRTAMKKTGLPEPVFNYNYSFSIALLDETEGKGVVALENAPVIALENAPQNVSVLQKGIIQEIIKNKTITYNQLAILLSKDKSTIRRNIQKLKSWNLITRVGSDKSGHWELKQK